jgi:predicted nucleic-acid-binding protein
MQTFLLDTNVIIRFLTGDHPVHSPQAFQLINEAIHGNIILYLESIVLAESVFVLTKVYEVPKSDVVHKLQRFLEFSGIHSQEKSVCTAALNIYGSCNIDFVDAFLAAKSKAIKNTTVVTYNAKDFKRAEAEFITPDTFML